MRKLMNEQGTKSTNLKPIIDLSSSFVSGIILYKNSPTLFIITIGMLLADSFSYILLKKQINSFNQIAEYVSEERIVNIVVSAGTLTVLLYGGIKTMQGEMTINELLIFCTLINHFLSPFGLMLEPL